MRSTLKPSGCETRRDHVAGNRGRPGSRTAGGSGLRSSASVAMTWMTWIPDDGFVANRAGAGPRSPTRVYSRAALPRQATIHGGSPPQPVDACHTNVTRRPHTTRRSQPVHAGTATIEEDESMKFWQKLSAAAVLAGSGGRLDAARRRTRRPRSRWTARAPCFPIAEAVAEEFQISKRGKVHVTVGIVRHRRRLQEILPRRNRHLECVASDPDGGDGDVPRRRASSTSKLPIAFDALTVVINPAEHLGQDA